MKTDETQEADETRDAETRNIGMKHVDQNEAYDTSRSAMVRVVGSQQSISAKQQLGVSASETRWRVGNSQLQSKNDTIRCMNCSCLG